MQQIAAELGYSESAFVTHARRTATTTSATSAREAEVPFCGHATIATGVALAERDGAGPLRFHTQAGEVPVATSGEQRRRHRDADERRRRTSRTPPDDLLDAALAALALDARTTSTPRSRRRSPTPAPAT